MLARFIVPVARLQDLPGHSDLFESATPLHLALLPNGSRTSTEFTSQLRDDLVKVSASLDEFGGHVVIKQIEARLPSDLLETDVIHVSRFLEELVHVLEDAGLEEANVFLEIPMNEFLHQTLPIVAGAAARTNRKRESSPAGQTALKMRTGGTESSAFPSVELVALFIAGCLRTGVPFKATAGLHHPVRRFDDELQTHMHGFLNLFGAAVLASRNGPDEARIAEILLEEDPRAFKFTDETFTWHELSASVGVIESVRSSMALSFGSCSFEEPVDDLRSLDFL